MKKLLSYQILTQVAAKRGTYEDPNGIIFTLEGDRTLDEAIVARNKDSEIIYYCLVHSISPKKQSSEIKTLLELWDLDNPADISLYSVVH